MKNTNPRALLYVFSLLVALIFSASSASAKDVPVTARAIQGRWKLLNVTIQDQQARAALLGSGLEMTFGSDKTVTVDSVNPESMSGVDSRKGVYRVENGKIAITIEGESAEDPARAVIRDGKHLVLLPSEKLSGEMIFARVNEGSGK